MKRTAPTGRWQQRQSLGVSRTWLLSFTSKSGLYVYSNTEHRMEDQGTGLRMSRQAEAKGSKHMHEAGPDRVVSAIKDPSRVHLVDCLARDYYYVCILTCIHASTPSWCNCLSYQHRRTTDLQGHLQATPQLIATTRHEPQVSLSTTQHSKNIIITNTKKENRIQGHPLVSLVPTAPPFWGSRVGAAR